MATKLHTFMDIFDSVFEVEGQEPVKLEKLLFLKFNETMRKDVKIVISIV